MDGGIIATDDYLDSTEARTLFDIECEIASLEGWPLPTKERYDMILKVIKKKRKKDNGKK